MIRSRDEREGEPARLLSWPRASPVLSRDPARRLRSTVSPRGSGPWEHTAHPSGQLTVAPLYCFLRCVQSLRPPHAEVRPPRPERGPPPYPRRAQPSVYSSIVSGKTPPPSDPDRDLGGQPTPTPRRPDPPTEAKVECHPRTLECQTLKMREPVRRRFVTDLPGFRRLLIRQGGVSSHREISGNKNSYIVL